MGWCTQIPKFQPRRAIFRGGVSPPPRLLCNSQRASPDRVKLGKKVAKRHSSDWGAFLFRGALLEGAFLLGAFLLGAFLLGAFLLGCLFIA